MKRQPVKRRARRRNTRVLRVDVSARERAFEALSQMRRGISLRKAAREAQTTPDTVRRYLPRAIDQLASGRYVAKPFDGYERTLYMLTPEGKIAVTVRGSRTASRIAEYWVAIDDFLKTGKTALLRPFRGQSIRASKVGYPFITNPNTLRRLGLAGEVSFEDLYALRG
jgi:hypothetical protein